MTSSIQYLATLDVLNRKKEEQGRLQEAMVLELERLCSVMASEKDDVDRLENESFTTSLLKLLRLHGGQLTKESEEYLKAKLDYERHYSEVEASKRQLISIEGKIEETSQALNQYRNTLSERRQRLEALPEKAPERAVYEKLSRNEKMIQSELIEIEEAIEACERADACKQAALGHLSDADDWADFDIWTSGGLITDLVKYDRIENAQIEMNGLTAALNSLKRELADIGSTTSLELASIDSSTKFLDVLFDNFISDLMVKNKITDQMAALYQLDQQLTQVGVLLESKRQTALGSLNACVEAIENLLMD